MLFQYLIFLYLVTGCFTAPQFDDSNRNCQGQPAEVFFLLDSSSSIWPMDFKKQLHFVSDIVDVFQVAPDKTRIGVASFSFRYHENIALDKYDSKERLQLAIKHIPQYFGGTYTYDALDGMRTRALSPLKVRPGVMRIGVVITDGESYNEKKTIEAAKRLKDDGVVLFAIGIGSKTNKDELAAIASDPKSKYLYEVGNYELLETIKEKLAIEACQIEPKDQTAGPAKPGCGKAAADIMFLVDTAVVGVTHTTEIYDFLAQLLEQFGISKGNNIQVGLESRNCGAGNIKLGEYADSKDLENALRNTQLSGAPHMLKRLRTHSFLPENGGRDNARHVAVMFVDDNLVDSKSVLDEARRTKNFDVELFVVAIGDSIDETELAPLCSDPVDRHLIRIPSYSELNNSKHLFLEKFCQGL